MPLLETLGCKVLCGKRHTTNLEGYVNPYPKVLKMPNCAAKDLDESGGVLLVPGDLPVVPGSLDILGFADAIANVEAKVREPACVEAQESGGVLLAAKAKPTNL